MFILPFVNVTCVLCHSQLPFLLYISVPAEHMRLNRVNLLQILATKDKEDTAESFKDDLTLTVREGQPLVLTPSQVKNMTLDDMVSIWKVNLPNSCVISPLHCCCCPQLFRQP